MAVALALVAAGCRNSADVADLEPTAPVYESLDLDTPEIAAATLIDAYSERDFVRAWYVFDSPVQQQLARSLNNLNFGYFRDGRVFIPNNVIEGSGEHPFWNGLAMIARLLDDAAQTGYLRADLAGAEIESVEDGDPLDGLPTAVVAVTLANGTSARLWMMTSPTERWRLRQIAIDGVDFDDSDRLVVDDSCGAYRVRVYDGSECPSTEIVVGADVGATDAQICAAVQGNLRLADAGITDSLIERAEELIASTCPGSTDIITDPPVVPPSEAEILDSTVYGRLDLSTPEAGVLTFTELFTNDAFMTLLFSLDAGAQGRLIRSINNLDVSLIANPDVLATWEGVVDEAHFHLLVGNFASLLIEAEATGNHILDLSGPFEIIGTSSTRWSERPGEEVDATVVEAKSETLGANVHFLMIESPTSRWRVRQVALDPAAFDSAENEGLVFIGS